MKLKLVAGEGELDKLRFDESGLIPAIVQEYGSGTVLMLAYMNREALSKTLETSCTWFWSRSRSSLWQKGETSGNIQKVKELYYDCDADALLVLVEQQGVACHTGRFSCFHNLAATGEPAVPDYKSSNDILRLLMCIIQERRVLKPEGSYVAYLFEQGLDKMLKKLGEEATEVIIAAKNSCRRELIYEAGDLLFHLLVLLNASDVLLSEVLAELSSRHANTAGAFESSK